ncbi:MAG: ThiF family adenylyltransferase, partial [Phycisphaerales bacterium]|nr:ThiF family adenylyltransferase [Phycisphaerales bacterium]
RLVDRDVVELTNLQRQVLYDERDVQAGTPKAVAAQNRLQAINSDINIEAIVDDVDASNIRAIADDCDLIIDGLDNFESRYLLNDYSTARQRPWIYGGAIGVTGMSAFVLPHDTACLRCIFPEPPLPGTSPTCDTAGILGPVISRVAAHQAMQAIKWLTGNIDAIDRTLHSFDAWANTQHAMTHAGPDPNCPCCGRGVYEWLDGERTASSMVLCGRDAVQIKPATSQEAIPLQQLADRLAEHGTFHCTRDVLHGRLHNGLEMTVFENGRALIKGTDSTEDARSAYARYIGT